MNMPLPIHSPPQAVAPPPRRADPPAPRRSGRAADAPLGWGLGLLLLLLLLAVAGIGLRTLNTPAHATRGQGEQAFSAERAMSRLERIAQRPHPTGSAENAAVRGYLVEQLRALGMTPEVQSGMGARPSDSWARVGMVHNIVARLPGQPVRSAADKALLLVAHYDSVPTGAGAADDGASVAAILETLRALKAGAPLKNDVIVLLTDGEEPGMLGSELFVRAHPWFAQAGLVLNFEYRGNAGPMLMFETSAGNGRLIDGYAAATAHPVSNSLLYELYRLLPNDTDLSTFKRAGLAAMNFAAIGHASAYHTQRDVPGALDRRTLQHQGDGMLALVRHFGMLPLDQLKAGDSVYFNLPGLGLLHYRAAWTWPLCLLVVGLFGLAMSRAARNGLARRNRVAAGAVSFVVIGLALAVACELMWLLVTAIHDEYRWFSDPHNSVWYLLAGAAFVLGGFAKLTQGLTRWIAPAEMSLGAAAVGVLLLVGVCLAMPGVSFLLTWSLLPPLALLGWMWSVPARADGARAPWLLLAALAPAVLLFVPVVALMHVGLGAQLIAATALAMVVFLGVLHPLLARLTRPYLLPALPVVLGLAFLVGGSLTRGFDAQQPRPTNLFYAYDANSERAFWISRDSSLDSWTRGVFVPGAPQRQVPEIFGAKSSRFWVAAAPRVDGLVAPSIEVLHDRSEGARRSVGVRVASMREAANLVLVSEGAALIEARVDGLPVAGAQKEQWRLSAFGVGAQGITLELTLAAGQPFELRVFDESYGLPALGLPARAADFMPTPFGSNGDTVRAVRALMFK